METKSTPETMLGGLQIGPDGVQMSSTYFIPWERLDSYPKLCEWLCHLAEKSWVSTDLLSDLITVTEAHFGWPHHYGV